MNWIFLVLLCGFVAGAFHFIGMYIESKSGNASFVYGISIFCMILTVFFFFFAILSTLFSRSNHVNDHVEYDKLTNVVKVYEEKAAKLTAEFTAHLAQTYPNLEREVFDKIAPEKLSVYLVQYPQLKSSETLVKLVEEINRLQDDVYKTKIAQEEIRADIASRMYSPWVFTWVLPDAPNGYEVILK